ncbi:MAG: PD-(D/E)XK nuclease family transposase [Saprospiraceae bacterium]
MLGSLDNEVIFKKAFTDKIVFEAFVKDILNLEVEIGKIETEKKFNPKIGYVDFELDIFAETTDKRIVIEIQRVEYDHHFDRFLYFFFMLIAEQQKNVKEYNIDQTVYLIVVLTAPYTINEKNGKAIKDEVLLININPQTLGGEIRDLYGHQFVCLNPNHPNKNTPQRIRDWLDLIYQSIHSPERPVLNTRNKGIKKAIELISFENLTPEERTASKNKEAAKVTIAKLKRAEKQEMAINAIHKKYKNEVIADITGLSITEVENLRKELN